MDEGIKLFKFQQTGNNSESRLGYPNYFPNRFNGQFNFRNIPIYSKLGEDEKGNPIIGRTYFTPWSGGGTSPQSTTGINPESDWGDKLKSIMSSPTLFTDKKPTDLGNQTEDSSQNTLNNLRFFGKSVTEILPQSESRKIKITTTYKPAT